MWKEGEEGGWLKEEEERRKAKGTQSRFGFARSSDASPSDGRPPNYRYGKGGCVEEAVWLVPIRRSHTLTLKG